MKIILWEASKDMKKIFDDFFENKGAEGGTVGMLTSIAITLAILVVCILVYIIMKKVLLTIITKIIRKNKFKWDDVLLERKVIHRAILIVPGVLFYSLTAFYENSELTEIMQRLASIYVLLVLSFVISSVLDSIDDIYRMRPISNVRPIKGLLQVVKIALFIVIGIVIIATLLDQSPLILLSGIGALAAVFSFVFKDSILGFIAGIQLTSNDMLRIGDWIEMPKYGADGDVVDITLNTVKVQNWDKTYVTIPAYALISDSFKNWRGMFQFGGRRIKRSVFIDVNSIGFCTEEMNEKFKKIHYLKDYINDKEKELNEHNNENNIDTEEKINGRHMTNLGTFRAYLKNYLANHSGIDQDKIMMVRQLAPGENGVPMEIYAFTRDTAWVNYEGVQSDIFDHVYAVAGEFGLRIFQTPSGYDLREIQNLYIRDTKNM